MMRSLARLIAFVALMVSFSACSAGKNPSGPSDTVPSSNHPIVVYPHPGATSEKTYLTDTSGNQIPVWVQLQLVEMVAGTSTASCPTMGCVHYIINVGVDPMKNPSLRFVLNCGFSTNGTTMSNECGGSIGPGGTGKSDEVRVMNEVPTYLLASADIPQDGINGPAMSGKAKITVK